MLRLMAFAGLSGLFLLAAWVHFDPVSAIDKSIMLMFRRAGDPGQPAGPLWLAVHFRDMTTLGSNWFLIVITGLAALVLHKKGQTRHAVFLIATVLSGMVVSFALKYGFHRPRPELVPHITKVYTSSFPSGHAMMSCLTYLSLAFTGASVSGNPSLTRWFSGIAMLIILLVGMSRVFLGVHWPTDILAGWCAAVLWRSLALMTMAPGRQNG